MEWGTQERQRNPTGGVWSRPLHRTTETRNKNLDQALDPCPPPNSLSSCSEALQAGGFTSPVARRPPVQILFSPGYGGGVPWFGKGPVEFRIRFGSWGGGLLPTEQASFSQLPSVWNGGGYSHPLQVNGWAVISYFGGGVPIIFCKIPSSLASPSPKHWILFLPNWCRFHCVSPPPPHIPPPLVLEA